MAAQSIVRASGGRRGRYLGWSALLIGLSLVLGGCPPTGDVPPFDPILPDAEPPVTVDAAPQPDAEPPVDPCEDLDNDGYVAVEGCELPSGDCDPYDGSRYPGAPELCNLIDDNCNGEVDEGNPEGGEECETGKLGVCAIGRTVCRQGELVCEQVMQRELVERCNGLDDNCDGRVDEDVPGLGGRCDTELEGVCAAGTLRCEDAEIRCIPNRNPGAELCNGLDDNCDGRIDEGNPEGGGVCDTGLKGICAAGVEECKNGELACMQSVEPRAELCNGLDDNCDGRTDEDFPLLGSACTVGVGACQREGVFVCNTAGDGVVCSVEPGEPSLEICNGIDDNCDGEVDEGFALGERCLNGHGLCRREGLTVCNEAGDGILCDAMPGESFDELCNNIDDNCDGQVDENWPELGQPCIDESDDCRSEGYFDCNAEGTGTVCVADRREPTPELCNGLDDDCDGLIDEDFEGLGQPCTVGTGACEREGVGVCDDQGGEICSATAGDPTLELCNGLDDDCDGRIDNGAHCAGPASGLVVDLQIAQPGDEGCFDFDGDGEPDNAFAGIAEALNTRLLRALLAGERPLIVTASDLTEAPVELGWLEATLDAQGEARPRMDAFDAAGRAKARLGGYGLEDGELTGGDPGQISLPSVLLYDASFGEIRHMQLAQALVRGGLSTVAQGEGLALQAQQLVLSARVNRAALLDSYALAEDACAAAGQEAPAVCADRLSLAQLEEALRADLAEEPEGPVVDLSLCLRFDIEPLDASRSTPIDGRSCQADSDCYAGLVCRAVPVVEDAQKGAALALRCMAPGMGGAPLGTPCDTDEDCSHGLCVAKNAEDKVCSTLCAADTDCAGGQLCRAVPMSVPGALNLGGASAQICVPAQGSGAACGAADSCAGGELCVPYLGGEVGVAGGEVHLSPRCERPSAQGARIGQACSHDLDCQRGLGCFEDLAGQPVCARLCSAGGQCGQGEVCAGRTLVEFESLQLSHGLCLTVPGGLGSGHRCSSAADCAPTETCRADFPAPSGAADFFCGMGAGFYAVGQPCGHNGDCLSGLCTQGFCSGPCESAADCGPQQTCNAEGWSDPHSNTLTGACGPILQACVFDNECTQLDPACSGGDCYCDNNQCKLGCRQGGSCADGQYCHENGSCAEYCRVDSAEPDDEPGEGLRLDVGRSQLVYEVDAWLCLGSPVDHYRLRANGQPFTLSVTPFRAKPGTLIELALLDEIGEVLYSTRLGSAQVAAGTLTLAIGAAEAAPLLGRELSVRVRAAGSFAAQGYTLKAQLQPLACVDPDGDEPRDNPWQAKELLIAPGSFAEETLVGAVCPGDVDWYGVYLHNGDTLRVTVDGTGDSPLDLRAELWGPDRPTMGTSGLRMGIGPGTETTFTAPQMYCSLTTEMCTLEDGTPTGIFCGDDNSECTGIGWYLRVMGAHMLVSQPYELHVSVTRTQNVPCVPDLYEQDWYYQDLERINAGLDPQYHGDVNGRLTFPLGKTVRIDGLRGCGANTFIPGETLIADRDRFTFYMARGERFKLKLWQDMTRLSTPQLYFFGFDRINPSVTRLVEMEPFWDAEFEFEYPASVADSYFSVDIVRPTQDPNPSSGAHINTYEYIAPYSMELTRLPFNYEEDTHCSPATRLTLSNNKVELSGNMVGAQDNHQPLGCLGGHGPDRIYVMRVPAGQGVLRATVIAMDGQMDPEVSIQRDCNAPNSEQACQEDDPTSPNPKGRAIAKAMVNGGNTGMDLHVVVNTPDFEHAGAYRLEVRYFPAAECNMQTLDCEDNCSDVQCPSNQFCDGYDGRCIDCLFDSQCVAGSRCQERRCVPGADREISQWGIINGTEPFCDGPADCTPDEGCDPIPLNPRDRLCTMQCSPDLACPHGTICCELTELLVTLGVTPICVPPEHPLAAALCKNAQ